MKVSDKTGSELHIHANVVYLKLQREKFSRRLGTLDSIRKLLVSQYTYGKDLFFSPNCFGFNYYLISNPQGFNRIQINTNEHETFIIPVPYILKNGRFIHFAMQGIEQQVYINISELIKFKI